MIYQFTEKDKNFFNILGIRYLNIKFRQTFKKIKHPFSADRNFRQRFLKIAEKYRAPKNAVAEKWRTLQYFFFCSQHLATKKLWEKQSDDRENQVVSKPNDIWSYLHSLSRFL